MSQLSLLRGMLAYVDNVDGKGSESFAAAILADPAASENFPAFVDVEMLAEVLETQAPSMRLIAENDPGALGERLFKALGVKR